MVCSTMEPRSILGALFCLFFASTLWSNPLCSAEYASRPTLRWSLLLEGTGSLSSRGMRKGNAVVAHNDGKRLVATMDDGSLHIVQTTPQVKSLSVFEPPSVGDKFTECRSGATIVYPVDDADDGMDQESSGGTPSALSVAAQGKSYVIYAVVDATVASDLQFDDAGFVLPSDTANTGEGSTTSRVLSVNMENGSLRWSVQVPGRIQGDVVVGTNAVYVSHNVGDVGFLSVIMVAKDGSSADVVATLTFSSGMNGPFGPPALQRDSGLGDVVIVAESWGQGYSVDQGGLYMLSPSADYENANGRGNDSYQLQKISTWSYSSVVAPLVDGNSVFLGAAGGNIAGWTGNDRSDLSGISSGKVDEIEPQWVFQMEQNPRNQSQPLMSAPVIDSTGATVCAAGVDSDFYCLITSNGRVGWTETTESQIMVRPQIWEDSSGSVVYTIESLNGRISQFDLYTGETYWQYSCADVGAFDDLCQASVEAEFAVAPSGNIIYYGDIFGRITSLEIASFQTDAPTISPTGLGSDGPTQHPTGAIVATESPSGGPLVEDQGDSTVFDEVGNGTESFHEEEKQQQDDKSANLGIYVGAALGGLCLLVVPIVVFWLMRGRKDQSQRDDDDDVLVEIIDDCDMDFTSKPRDLEDLEVSTDASTSDGIEIEYKGSQAVAMTPPRRKKKKKKRKKSPQAQTPQTTMTLESIEEIEEEVGHPGSQNERFELDIEGQNLSRKFAMAASDSGSSRSFSQSSQSGDERNDSPPISPGGVGVASGTNHLELAVGGNNNSNLSPLFPGRVASSDSDDASEQPPPPPPTTLSSSSNQWSWGKLLNFGSSKPVKDKDSSVMERTNSITNEQVILRPVANKDMNLVETTESMRIASPEFPADEVSHRAETPTAGNHGKIHSYIPDSVEDDERSWPGVDNVALSPKSDCRSSGVEIAKFNNDNAYTEPKVRLQDVNMEIVEEEKKENEDTYSQPRSPVAGRCSTVSPAMHVANASRENFSPVSRISEQSNGRVFSPNEQSQASDYISSPLSPARSPSNLSTDDSLYTSATGATGDKVQDTSNLSPLSTNLFDREIPRRDRSDIPHDEARGALSPPDLTDGKKDQFRYLDEEQDVAPDDEVNTAPGFQYMTHNERDANRREKFGRSVRSKSDSSTSFKSQLAKQNSFGSTGSGGESPLAAIYNQLAIMGQKQAEEKKHSFKRRSKKGHRGQTSESDSDSEQQEANDNWGYFLQELAEAEKQFFSPTSIQTSSLLKMSESHDSEDSEVARINNTL